MCSNVTHTSTKLYFASSASCTADYRHDMSDSSLFYANASCMAWSTTGMRLDFFSVLCTVFSLSLSLSRHSQSSRGCILKKEGRIISVWCICGEIWFGEKVICNRWLDAMLRIQVKHKGSCRSDV